jgi:hypothetical protein
MQPEHDAAALDEQQSPTELLQHLQQDPFLKSFTDAEFDSAALACRIVAHSSAASSAAVPATASHDTAAKSQLLQAASANHRSVSMISWVLIAEHLIAACTLC